MVASNRSEAAVEVPSCARGFIRFSTVVGATGWMLLVLSVSLVLLNVFMFRNSLALAISTNTNWGLHLIHPPTVAFPYKLQSTAATGECRKCDRLTPSLKHAIAEYVHLLLSQGGDQSMGIAALELQRDYALEADGGSIVYELISGSSWWHTYVPRLSSTVHYAINDSRTIGHCWSLSTTSGQLGILLAEPFYPSSITIDHIPQMLAADIRQAPRQMILWGLLDG